MLFRSLSAINGFEREVTAQMIGKDAHFEVQSYQGDPIFDYEVLASQIRSKDSSIIASAPYIIYKVGISSKKVNDGIVSYGIDAERSKEVVDVHKHMFTCRQLFFSFSIYKTIRVPILSLRDNNGIGNRYVI